LALEPSGNAKPREITFESVQTPGEMARILCSYVVEFEADEAIICRYREHFWTRLKCGLRDVDLLFQAE
jgi:hypothetical protein